MRFLKTEGLLCPVGQVPRDPEFFELAGTTWQAEMRQHHRVSQLLTFVIDWSDIALKGQLSRLLLFVSAEHSIQRSRPGKEGEEQSRTSGPLRATKGRSGQTGASEEKPQKKHFQGAQENAEEEESAKGE
jgi:hypothetical protein